MKSVIQVLLLLLIFSCKREKDIKLTKYIHHNHNNKIDSFTVNINYSKSNDKYNFSIFDNKKDTLHVEYLLNDTNYIYLFKTINFKNKDYNLLRIDNSKIAVPDGLTYTYLLENGRPLLEYSRDWSINWFYFKNQKELQLIKYIINDTSCFYRCPPPPPPPNPNL